MATKNSNYHTTKNYQCKASQSFWHKYEIKMQKAFQKQAKNEELFDAILSWGQGSEIKNTNWKFALLIEYIMIVAFKLFLKFMFLQHLPCRFAMITSLSLFSFFLAVSFRIITQNLQEIQPIFLPLSVYRFKNIYISDLQIKSIYNKMHFKDIKITMKTGQEGGNQ